MNRLIGFTNAHDLEEKIFVAPDEVVSIQPVRKNLGLDLYSKVTLKNGTAIDVSGSPEDTAKEINRNRGWGQG